VVIEMVNMPIPFKVKAVKIGNSIRMTIPKPVVDYLKISKGDTLEVTVQDTEMVVKKLTNL
jgi:AbrB family looped-hinge helix DNA binding protein